MRERARTAKQNGAGLPPPRQKQKEAVPYHSTVPDIRKIRNGKRRRRTACNVREESISRTVFLFCRFLSLCGLFRRCEFRCGLRIRFLRRSGFRCRLRLRLLRRSRFRRGLGIRLLRRCRNDLFRSGGRRLHIFLFGILRGSRNRLFLHRRRIGGNKYSDFAHMVHDLIAQFKHIQNAPHGDRKCQKGNRLVRSVVLIDKVEKINGNQSAGQDDTMDAVTKNLFHVFLLQFTLTFRDRNMQKTEKRLEPEDPFPAPWRIPDCQNISYCFPTPCGLESFQDPFPAPESYVTIAPFPAKINRGKGLFLSFFYNRRKSRNTLRRQGQALTEDSSPSAAWKTADTRSGREADIARRRHRRVAKSARKRSRRAR